MRPHLLPYVLQYPVSLTTAHTHSGSVFTTLIAFKVGIVSQVWRIAKFVGLTLANSASNLAKYVAVKSRNSADLAFTTFLTA